VYISLYYAYVSNSPCSTHRNGNLELEGDEELMLFKGPVLPQVTQNFTANILTLSTLAMPIIPGSSFELYLKGVEVSNVLFYITRE
jgi:hypothetical protein